MSFFGFPSYVGYDSDAGLLRIAEPARVSAVLTELSSDKRVIPSFADHREWVEYLGDPEQMPDWFRWLRRSLDFAPSHGAAEDVLAQYEPEIATLAPKAKKAIQKKSREKHIEDYYEKNPGDIDPASGLKLYERAGVSGRQFRTDVGPIDLLCVDDVGRFVVIEIKVGPADDSSIGQVLRYMGWVDKNLRGASGRVRGIILAADFPEQVHYARSSILGNRVSGDENVEKRLKFVQHGFALKEA